MIDASIPIDAPAAQIVARYRFESSINDTTGNGHDGTMIGGPATYGTGYTLLGLLIPPSANSHLFIPDSPAFDILSGRIELRFKYDGSAPAGDLGLFSRDANGTSTDGHINIRIGHDRRVVVRIQRTSNPSVEAYRCTANPLSANAWHHVEVSFGPGGLIMRTDGGVVSGTTWVNGSGDTLSCTGAWTGGIAGNNNPIILGALSITSNEGTGAPVIGVAGGVVLDDVELWNQP